MLNTAAQLRTNRATIKDTEKALRSAGADGYELFVLWTGRLVDDIFTVDHVYVPKQQSFRLDDGLCVRVEADELHRLNVWLYKERQLLGAQIHSHPRYAYHSETDDAFPIVTTLGGLSIVVPNFCRGGVGDPGTAVYRLGDRGWRKISRSDASALVPGLFST